jgi:hypothetical protein
MARSLYRHVNLSGVLNNIVFAVTRHFFVLNSAKYWAFIFLIFYVKMHIVLHKMKFNEAMSRHPVVICSADRLKIEVKK